MTLPVQTEALTDERRQIKPVWRRWAAALERRITDLAAAIGALREEVANIPAQANTDALIVGLDGILTEGRISDGRVTVKLVDLEDSGEGAGLYKITRDAKGRIEGSQSAWPDVMARLSMRV